MHQGSYRVLNLGGVHLAGGTCLTAKELFICFGGSLYCTTQVLILALDPSNLRLRCLARSSGIRV